MLWGELHKLGLLVLNDLLQSLLLACCMRYARVVMIEDKVRDLQLDFWHSPNSPN
jgi:hypothetical protein